MYCAVCVHLDVCPMLCNNMVLIVTYVHYMVACVYSLSIVWYVYTSSSLPELEPELLECAVADTGVGLDFLACWTFNS